MALLALCASLTAGHQALGSEAAFPGLSGPDQLTTLPPAHPTATDPSRYQDNGRNSLAVFLRDPDSSWLGLAHGLKAAGIPFFITVDLETALAHDVVVVYPSVTGANTATATLQRLRSFVEAGNTLLAFSVIGNGMRDIFGYRGYRERNDLKWLRFTDHGPETGPAVSAEDSLVGLAGHARPAGGVSYLESDSPAIATFDDGSAAIVHKRFDRGEKTGHAYAVGFDIGHFALRTMNGRLAGVVDDYVNAYHPDLDNLFRFIAAVYRQGESDPVSILSTPFNHEFTLLITHDVDYSRSLANVDYYLDLESQLGVPATYFIQTKYVTDYNDRAFFNAASRPVIARLQSAGMAIASHSVAHSNEFRHMAVGTGKESYPDYQPFVKDFETVQNASITGELRVSRFLLEQLGADTVTAFRPGHLSLPRKLPELLQATGYRYSSSITANEALTHLPYQTMFSSEYHREVQVWEFPVTIEDEQGDLLDRLDQSIALANRIGRHGGLVNLLIHTDEAVRKLEFERRFIETFRQRAWFDTVPGFGRWWQLRDSAEIDVETLSAESRKLTVTVAGSIAGLGLRVPPHWRLDGPHEGVVQSADVLVFEQLAGQRELLIRLD